MHGLALVRQFFDNADLLIIGGTSLSVYPASGLINYYRGDKLVLINKGATEPIADLQYMTNIHLKCKVLLCKVH